MNNGIMQFALQMLRSNPQVAQTPMGQQFMTILQNGDQQKGIELANNLCQSYGITPEQALQQARTHFHI